MEDTRETPRAEKALWNFKGEEKVPRQRKDYTAGWVREMEQQEWGLRGTVIPTLLGTVSRFSMEQTVEGGF